eukprot:TRINITY_DN18816_c0_g1_i1.p1 TRINITY_DN18816_c0_g1~~TRINITY_DN18816_c0_g1_i1.p1  ORF type:complete len:363 (-),score=123.14 TRINITY_DN18816_c0_g1_i1:261-1349(-)
MARKETIEQENITFLIGVSPCTEKIPAKPRMLAERSPVFRAMLEGPLAENRDRIIVIKDVDPRAFEILISFMTGDVVKFKSVLTALAVIYVAKKYMVKKIDDLALKYIKKNINSDNVLLVLQHLLILNHRDTITEEEFFDPTPSAPPLELFDQLEDLCDETHFSYNYNETDTKIDKNCEAAVEYCFDVIDKNAKKVLGSDEFEDTSLKLMKDIIKRDTLRLSSEQTVLEAVNRWSHRQCRRQHLTPSQANKREVLQGSQYLVRYLTMTSEEFKTGQRVSNLLTEEEEINILFSLLHLGAVLPKDLQEYRCTMQTLRKKRRSWRKRIWIRRKPAKINSRREKTEKENISFGEEVILFISHFLD